VYMTVWSPVAVTTVHVGLAFFFVAVGSIFSVLDALADSLEDDRLVQFFPFKDG